MTSVITFASFGHAASASVDGVSEVGSRSGVENSEKADMSSISRCVEYEIGEMVCYETEEEYATDFVARTGQTPRDSAGERRALQAAGLAAESEQLTAAARRGTYWDCPSGWTCLWQYKNFSASGRMLQWSQPGIKELADWTFRDEASSSFRNTYQNGYKLTNVRTGLPDTNVHFGAMGVYSDFSEFGFDNKADRLTIY